MGLGKTVMAIGLILTRPGRGCPANQEYGTEIADTTEITKKTKKDCHMNTSSKANGGTLIVCPMALLGQWKVNILSLMLKKLKDSHDLTKPK